MKGNITENMNGLMITQVLEQLQNRTDLGVDIYLSPQAKSSIEKIQTMLNVLPEDNQVLLFIQLHIIHLVEIDNSTIPPIICTSKLALHIADRKAGVYLLMTKNGYKYLGSTTDLSRRLSEHMSAIAGNGKGSMYN